MINLIVKILIEVLIFKKKQSAVTKISEKRQIAGSKVFEWKWVVIQK